jgi:EAL domain-containing protein (putative c-di-GMP-specific phosphodiesterase class I)
VSQFQDEDIESQDSSFRSLLETILTLGHGRTDPLPELSSRVNIQLCGPSEFGTRLQQTLYRADRMGQSFVLVLLQVTSGQSHGDPTPLILQRIRGSLRKSDSLMQLGTEHFAVLLDNITEPDAIPFAVEKIIHTLDPPFTSRAGHSRFPVRAGASVFPEDGYLPVSLWVAAQTALRSSSGQGADRLRFANTRQHHHTRERLELCSALHRGLRNREFDTAYQPVIDTLTGRVRSVEILLRWRHPQRGIQPTERFLHLLEETGLIIPVGEWLMELAFRQARQLRDAGHRGIRLGINLSARQMFEPGFVERMVWLIQDRGHDPAMIELECPEAVLMRNLEASREVVRQLAGSGVPVCIDRFGGNNHALAELMRLPLAGLKIDRKLIRRLPFDRTSKAIIGGILAFADCMGITASACGVENAGQLKFLRERACLQAQGNHIARPMSFAELERWLPN